MVDSRLRQSGDEAYIKRSFDARGFSPRPGGEPPTHRGRGSKIKLKTLSARTFDFEWRGKKEWIRWSRLDHL